MLEEKCNCGKLGRYLHTVEGVPMVLSCNKYSVCPTYDQLLCERDLLRREHDRYEKTLNNIVRVNAMDYEYRTWAKQTLENK